MAYIKQFTTSSGIEGNYWRITKAEVNKIAAHVIVEVSLYVSKALREAGKTPVTKKSFLIPISSVDTSKDLFEEAYKAIKNANERDSQNPLMQGTAYFADAEIG